MIDAMRRRGLVSAVLGLGLVSSQAGHLLAFQMRFGSAAQHLQSSGAHAYFPTLAKTTLGAIGAAFVAAVFVMGLARVLAGRSRVSSGSAPKYIELIAALFTIQLACFITQEVGEAMAAGAAVDSAAHLLLWGTLGQLPVAALAATALGWLWMRFESAVDDLRAVLASERIPVMPEALSFAPWHVPGRALLLSQVAGGSLGKRGPPSSLRLSS
jgi:hypothetical protein